MAASQDNPGIDFDRIAPRLERLAIELPTWGFADTGTRFGKFAQDAAALTIEDNPRIHYSLAELLFESGKKKESAEHYKKAWPGFVEDLDNIVRIAHRLGKTRSYEDCVQ